MGGRKIANGIGDPKKGGRGMGNSGGKGGILLVRVFFVARVC